MKLCDKWGKWNPIPVGDLPKQLVDRFTENTTRYSTFAAFSFSLVKNYA